MEPQHHRARWGRTNRRRVPTSVATGGPKMRPRVCTAPLHETRLHCVQNRKHRPERLSCATEMRSDALMPATAFGHCIHWAFGEGYTGPVHQAPER